LKSVGRAKLAADCHAHIYPLGRSLYTRRSVTFSASDLIKRMDEFGVVYSSVLAHPAPAATVDDGAREHDLVAAQIKPFADSLVPWCWVTPRWGSVGIAEARRCLGLGFRGVVLDPIQEGFELDEPSIDPLCKLAADAGVPVFVETYLEHRGAEPWRLIALAGRYPSVPFIMAHLGGIGLQQNMTGATLAAEVPNVYLETSCTKSDPFATFEGPARILGAERVLLGSNQPLHHVALNLRKLELTALAEDEKDLIRGLNFLRLVGVKTKQPIREGLA
jgi:predicted TIM-barrel fold metal-dependent hydrolase